MPNAASPPVARPLEPWAAFLSYLVPGLGQIYQGRIAKGVLFLVCIYTLFFYGMYLGSGTVTLTFKDKDDEKRTTTRTYRVSGNVYLPDTANEKNNPLGLPHFAANLYNRPQYVGQFWAGVVAWPALLQYLHADDPRPAEKDDSLLGDFERTPSEEALNAVHTSGDKRLELGWVYTVIAGVLNILVIYDALAGPAFLGTDSEPTVREGVA